MTTRLHVRKSSLIYADHAATSFPKPREVIRAMTEVMETKGGNPGRGTHSLSLAAAEEMYACRETASAFFGLGHPERVVFTMNTTHALNLFMRGVLQKGDHVLCSDLEHNSVWRPLYALSEAGEITFDTFASFAMTPVRNEEMILQDICRKLKPQTKLLVCTHASNLCAVTMPIEAIGALCKERGILFCVDAAQSAGRLPIHMQKMHIDALCVPGHKGLLGPLGTGLLLLSPDVNPTPLLWGGNGVASLSPQMAGDAPEMYEAGTQAAPAIAGLRAGMEYVRRVGMDSIRQREETLGKQLKNALRELPFVTLYVPHHAGGTVLFSIRNTPSEAVGDLLNEKGICVRAGFHCSALGHKTLRTPTDGAVRVSFGYNNTEGECDRLISAVSAMGQA